MNNTEKAAQGGALYKHAVWLEMIGRAVAMHKLVVALVSTGIAVAAYLSAYPVISGIGYGFAVACIFFWLLDRFFRMRAKWVEEYRGPFQQMEEDRLKSMKQNQVNKFVAKYWDQAYVTLQGDPIQAERVFRQDIAKLLEPPQ
jgi:hypothetical protein